MEQEEEINEEIEENKQLSSSQPIYSEEDVDQALRNKKEEIETKAKQELREELLLERETLVAEKNKLEDQIQAMTDKQKNKEYNFEQLRKKVDGAEDLKKKLNEMNVKIEQLKEEPIKAIKEEFIHENIGDDPEDQKVFNYYYERLKVDAPDRESARKMLQQAYLLFQDIKGTLNINPFGNILGTKGRPILSEGLTAIQKEVFSKFGVTTDMIKKVKGVKDND